MKRHNFYKIIGISIILLSISTWVAAGTWGYWSTIGNSGIDWRVQCTDYNQYAKKVNWNYELRSRYRQPVGVYYTVSDGRGNDSKGGMRLRPGATESSWGLFAINCGQRLKINISKIEPEN